MFDAIYVFYEAQSDLLRHITTFDNFNDLQPALKRSLELKDPWQISQENYHNCVSLVSNKTTCTGRQRLVRSESLQVNNLQKDG